jgi:hypothetical protein
MAGRTDAAAVECGTGAPTLLPLNVNIFHDVVLKI